MPERWIVLSLDALATTAIGAYGSPWNTTPAIDSLATEGVVLDRVIATDDDSAIVLASLWGRKQGDKSWLDTWKSFGRAELFLNAGPQATELAKLADKVAFDQCTIVEAIPDLIEPSIAGEEIETTAMAKLLLPVLERIELSATGDAADFSLLWIHSDTLARLWDAPRWLFPIEEQDDDEQEPEDYVEWSMKDFESASTTLLPTDAPQTKPPSLFETSTVPFFAVSPDAHPDLITSWMQTYGCQIKLLDALVAMITDAIDAHPDDIGLAVLGTSGISLGQNGWIGHRAGSIRSPQIHVPAIVLNHEGIGNRMPGLRAFAGISDFIRPGSHMSPEVWARDDDPNDRIIETHSLRATRVVTTDQWFFVREGDDSRLFLKPDDRDDMNDVADRCRDVVETLEGNAR